MSPQTAVRDRGMGTGEAMQSSKMPENGTIKVARHDGGITKSRKSLHLSRKIFHALAGVGMALLYEIFLDRHQTLIVFSAMFLLLGMAEYLRLFCPESFFARLVLTITGALARTYEVNHISGMLFFVAGVSTSVFFYPKNVAVLGILFLSVGDPCASACGIRFGYLGMRFSNGKTLIGYLGGVISCAMCTICYYWGSHAWQWQLAVVAIIGGLAGATTELVCGRKIASDGTVSGGPINVDDNLAVPIFAGGIFLATLNFFPSFL